MNIRISKLLPWSKGPFCLLFIGVLFGFSAWAQKPKAAETQWPGVTAEVHTITRLPDNRVSVKFIFRANSSAPAITYIADRPITNLKVVDQVPILGPNAKPVGETPVMVEAFSIAKGGQLIAEESGGKFASASLKAGDNLAPEAHPGITETFEGVERGGAFFLGAVFNCPPINEDKPPKPQFVSFQLPGINGAISRVLLPRVVNQPHCFFPPTRYSSPPPTNP